jgi:hypothetical protein
MSRARLEGVPAGANDISFVVSGVNTGLHCITRILSKFQYSKQNPRGFREPTGAGSL